MFCHHLEGFLQDGKHPVMRTEDHLNVLDFVLLYGNYTVAKSVLKCKKFEIESLHPSSIWRLFKGKTPFHSFVGFLPISVISILFGVGGVYFDDLRMSL